MACIALVVPATTYRAANFLEAATALQAEVVVASDQSHVLAETMGDRALRIDLAHPEAAAERLATHAERKPFDAIVGIDDRGVEIAALASQRLGLRHSPPAAVAATRNKARLRAILEGAADVRQPRWTVVGDPAEAARAAATIGFPVVVKPVSLSASRGVIRADDEEEALAAAERSLAIVAEAGEEPELLVERYVDGEEVALEGLVRDGTLVPLALFDKPDPLVGPFFEETLYTTPSRLPSAVQTRIEEAAQAVVDGVGLSEGPVHAEFRLGGDDVWVLELASRTIGGLCGSILRFGLDMSLEEVVLRQALDLPLHALARESTATGVMMLPVARAGTLVEVAGVDAARAVPGIEGVEVTVRAGQTVRPLPEADRYLGFAFARDRTPEAVEESLRTAYAKLDVRIELGATVGSPCDSD